MPIRYAILVLLVSTIPLSGCSFDGRLGYKTDDPVSMGELQKELKEKKIPFEVDDQGFIRYSSKYESDVESTIKSVDHYLHGGIVSKYDEAESNKYLRELLTKKGMKYRVEKRSDGEWTRWYPENDKQRKAISNEVVEHYFNQKKNDLKDCNKDTKSSPKAARSVVVIRATLLKQGLNCDKYCWNRYLIKRVLKGASELAGKSEILIAVPSWLELHPNEVRTLNIEHYSDTSPKLWKLVPGESE